MSLDVGVHGLEGGGRRMEDGGTSEGATRNSYICSALVYLNPAAWTLPRKVKVDKGCLYSVEELQLWTVMGVTTRR